MKAKKNKRMIVRAGILITLLTSWAWGQQGQQVLPKPRIIYVDDDASGANDGSSWDNAFSCLREALEVISDGDVILVADGVYTGEGNKDLNCTGKAVTIRSENGPENCIIDCENDGRAFTFGRDENGDIAIDGFTICHGSADRGGGIYYGFSASGRRGSLKPASLTINNCVFRDNSAEQAGGAVYCQGDNPRFTDCLFSQNSAGLGGGMYNSFSSPTLTNCTFEGNLAKPHGGGMYSGGDAVLTHCIFRENSTEGSGGAGGGMYTHEGDPVLINCIFTGNSTPFNGGGIYDHFGHPVLTNCIFSGNSAARYGGGIYNRGELSLISCTFSQNLATNGAALACYSYGRSEHVELSNCILWDKGGEIFNEADSIITISYSNLQGGREAVDSPLDALVWHAGNIDADPLFVDPSDPDGIAGTHDDDLRLQLDSPCRDSGDNSLVSQETDLKGDPRIHPTVVDMGCFEYVGRSWYVDGVHGSDDNDGLSVETSLKSIVSAVELAQEADVVFVNPGVYKEYVFIANKDIVLQGIAGPSGIPIIAGPTHSNDGVGFFFHNESVMRNFVIRGCTFGVTVMCSDPTLTNLTIVDNAIGIDAGCSSDPIISNCIFRNSELVDLNSCVARYSCIQHADSLTGKGNISADPLLTKDYHLASSVGYYQSETQDWLQSDVISQCIDTGDPQSPIGLEPSPHGDRINMGAYGGTAYASLSDQVKECICRLRQK